jgi:hypothetical protein
MALADRADMVPSWLLTVSSSLRRVYRRPYRQGTAMSTAILRLGIPGLDHGR